MHSDQTLTVCSPQIGIDPESNLGGAVYDREILKERVGQRGGRWSWRLVSSGCLTTFGIGVTPLGRQVAKELKAKS